MLVFVAFARRFAASAFAQSPQYVFLIGRGVNFRDYRLFENNPSDIDISNFISEMIIELFNDFKSMENINDDIKDLFTL